MRIFKVKWRELVFFNMLPLLFDSCLFLIIYATREKGSHLFGLTSLLLLIKILKLFVLISKFTIVWLQMNTLLDLVDGFIVLLLFAVSLTHQEECFGGLFLANNYRLFAIVNDIFVLVHL